MPEAFAILALLFFAASAIVAGIAKVWWATLMAAGLLLWVLASDVVIHIR